MASDEPLFLVGAPRSGTTLLQQLLSPVVAIGPETHFVRRYWIRRRRFGDLNDEERWTHLKAEVAASAEFRDSGVAAEALSSSPRSYPGLLKAWIRGYGELLGADRVGEKTPNHILAMDRLAEWFPGARFVHVLRDPRAVTASARDTPWSTGSLAGDANVWRQYVRSARLSASALGGNYLVLRYEDLVAAPQRELERVCSFAGLPAISGGPRSGAVGVNLSREPWKQGSAALPHSASIDRWRHRLSPREVAEIEAITGPEMRRWGYCTETAPSRVLAPMLARAHQVAALQMVASVRSRRV
jgi:hypothetical protein